MNKVLKIKQTEDQKVFFTSDTHWNHNPKWEVPLWEARGYKSIEESNAHIVTTINQIVGENDILFHLGDLTLNCDETQFETFIGSLKCQTIYTLWGNHNNPANKIYQREVRGLIDTTARFEYEENCEVYPLRYKNLVFIGNYAEVIVDGLYFILSHYPVYVFNYMKGGAMHLCGHSHYNLPLSQADDLNSKILDVGWDGWARPISVSEVVEIMKKKGTLKVDHHQREQMI